MNPDFSTQFPHFHLGCGPLIAPGYLNIDGEFPTFDFSQAMQVDHPYQIDMPGKPILLKYDLRRGIPSKNEGLLSIYHSHFLEHLTRAEGLILLQECFRALKPGGVMRVVVPDLALWCRSYSSNDTAFFDWYRTTYLANNRQLFPTNGSVFMGMLYNWGHQMSYDEETLSCALRSTGFMHIERKSWSSSEKMQAMEHLESNNPRQFESLILECVKP